MRPRFGPVKGNSRRKPWLLTSAHRGNARAALLAALEQVVTAQGRHCPRPSFNVSSLEHAEEEWITDNGARMVARAWTDPSFRARMIADGTKVAAKETRARNCPSCHRQLVVLERRGRCS